MGDVVFGSFKRKGGADRVVDALCEVCQFSWSVLMPEGMDCCKCPLCGGLTDQLMDRDSEEAQEKWQCECGSVTFHITSWMVSCSCCGEMYAEMVPS